MVSWPESSASWPATSRTSSPDGPSASRVSARWLPRRRSAIDASRMSPSATPRSAAARLRAPPRGRDRRSARRPAPARRTAQGRRGGWASARPAARSRCGDAAVDRLGRRRAGRAAAQLVLADQRRRRRQARPAARTRPSRARDRRAEWPKATMVTVRPGSVASLPPRRRTSVSSRRARHAMQAADEEERLPGEGHGCDATAAIVHAARPLCAPARRLGACGLRSASPRPRGASPRPVLLGARGRRLGAAAAFGLQAALQRVHDVDDLLGAGVSGHREGLARPAWRAACPRPPLRSGR